MTCSKPSPKGPDVHFHHRHDVDGCVDAHEDWPEIDRVILATLDRLEAQMSSVQEQIDALAADLEQVEAALAAKPAPEAAPDLSKLSAVVDQLKVTAGVAAAPVAPVVDASGVPSDAAPVDAPVAPVDAAPAGPVDITVTDPAAQPVPPVPGA